MKKIITLLVLITVSLSAEKQKLCPIYVEDDIDTEEFVNYKGVKVYMCCGRGLAREVTYTCMILFRTEPRKTTYPPSTRRLQPDSVSISSKATANPVVKRMTVSTLVNKTNTTR